MLYLSKDYFTEQFYVQGKLTVQFRSAHLLPVLWQAQLLSCSTSCYQGGTLATISEITLTPHDPQQPTVQSRTHSWCCTFCGFWQKDQVCPALHYQKIFTALQSLCAQASPSPITSCCLYSIFFLGKWYSWDHTVHIFSWFVSFI